MADSPGGQEEEEEEDGDDGDDHLDIPGVVAAADDPPLTTIEPHLEMSYNRQMPGNTRLTDRQSRQRVT